MELTDEYVRERINENLRLTHRRQGLTFGTDAYLLAAYVRAKPQGVLLDLGSGTGVIPLLLLARNRIGRAVGVEIQKPYCELIEYNAADNGFSERLRALHCDVRELTPEKAASAFPEGVFRGADVVTANPPYMKVGAGKENDSEERYIARHEVFGDIRDFCRAAAGTLRYGGSFYVVYRPDRLTALLSGLREANLEPKRMTFVQADGETAASSVLVEARLFGAPGLTLTPALLLHDAESRGQGNRPLSPAARKIYDTFSFADAFTESR